MANALTYSLLDDLELAFDHGPGPSLNGLSISVRSLGPLIQLGRSLSRSEILQAINLDCGRFESANEFIANPKGIYVDPTGTLGMAVPTDDGESALELMQRALLAINKTQLPRSAATQVASALGELDSNITSHSKNEVTGISAYEVTPTFVGIYASDLGQGVLQSLRANPAFSHLTDEGDAIRLSLEEGVSSSPDPARGNGFRPIFTGLASHCGLLRFRSGDALLEINGFARDRPSHDTKERASIAGFHAFAHCVLSRA